MENILLFSVEMDPRDILSREPDFGVSINYYDHMTNKETEQMQQLLGAASEIVIAAMLRSLNEVDFDEYDEDDDDCTPDLFRDEYDEED